MRNLLFKAQLVPALILFSVLFPEILYADFFEGVLTLAGGSGKTRYMVKGSKTRLEVQPGPSATTVVLVDYTTGKVAVLMPQGTYSEKDIHKGTLIPPPQPEGVKIERTDETADIQGYTCSKYIIRHKKGMSEVWVAESFGKFYQPDFNSNLALEGMKKRLEAVNGFPFRVISYSPDKRELFRMEVSNVEKKDLDDSLFKVPEGYRRLDLPPVPNTGMPGLNQLQSKP